MPLVSYLQHLHLTKRKQILHWNCGEKKKKNKDKRTTIIFQGMLWSFLPPLLCSPAIIFYSFPSPGQVPSKMCQSPKDPGGEEEKEKAGSWSSFLCFLCSRTKPRIGPHTHKEQGIRNTGRCGPSQKHTHSLSSLDTVSPMKLQLGPRLSQFHHCVSNFMEASISPKHHMSLPVVQATKTFHCPTNNEVLFLSTLLTG